MSYSQTLPIYAGTDVYDRPSNWNPLDCKIEGWGAGASGGRLISLGGGQFKATTGGPGGSYASVTNVDLPSSFTCVVADDTDPAVDQAVIPGGDTSLYGEPGSPLIVAPGGASTTQAVGEVTYRGGGFQAAQHGGGDGAGGPDGNGVTGAATGGAGNNGLGGAGGALNADGTDDAKGGGGSGRRTMSGTIRGGFPGGGSGTVSDSVADAFSQGRAGKIVLSWNPA